MRFFDMLYFNCNLHQIDPQQIIFVSSNLLDKTNLLNHCTREALVPFNYTIFSAFEYIVADEMKCQIKEVIERIEKSFEHCHPKNFLSLSKRNRPHRDVFNFLLHANDLIENNIVSHNVLNISDKQSWINQNALTSFDINDVDIWQQSLPLIADKKDFDSEIWSWEPPAQLYDSSCFSVVNETFADSYDNTSLFYSEKTFRCISHLQPFIVLGQPDCNANLSILGYKLYDDWFDYSFDSIENEKQRINDLVKQLLSINKQLNRMNKKQKLDWRFTNLSVLEHNFQHLKSNTLNRKIFKEFSKRF